MTAAPGRLPDGQRVYAIGDVHGCLARLQALHALIGEDLARRPVASPRLVHLGDYVDRGPDSAGVVQLLAQGDPLPGVPTVNLMGNHESTMLAALDGDGAAATDWTYNGGTEALRSWGIDPLSPRLEWAIPRDDHEFLRGLMLSHRVGSYIFVHAGLRPGVAFDAQDPHDLLTIRQPFLSSDADFGGVVVHGHTPIKKPEVHRNRIGIDTGAVFSGALTCVVLEKDRVAFLSC